MQKAAVRALEKCGLTVERYAKKLAPFDTGLLRNSITHALAGEPAAISEYKASKGDKKGSYSGSAPKDSKGEISVYIGTNVEYSVCQELGTGGNKAKPFLKPAVADHADTYRKIIEGEMKNG